MEDKLQQIPEHDRLILQDFSKTCNKVPTKKEVKVNPFANGSKYLPISFIEMTLDEMFFGLWQTKNFTSQIVVNEIIGSIELEIFHPIAKIWITRIGAASTPIQMVSGSGVTAVEKKIKNTLVKDYPHLKTECLKNAAKSLGKAFGRDLNREFEDKYVPLMQSYDDADITTGQVAHIESLINNTVLDEKIIEKLENEMQSFSIGQAKKCIQYLFENQKPTLNEQMDESVRQDRS